MLKKIYLIFIFLLSISFKVFASDEIIVPTIVDNSNLIQDRIMLEDSFKNFKEKTNIDVYVIVLENSSQNEFEETINNYESNISNDFLLYYISKETGDVGIYNSKSLDSTINDAKKVIMLTSMEKDFNEGNFENGIIISLDNLFILLDNEELIGSNNESLVEKNINGYVIIMIVCAIVFILPMIIQQINKKRRG